MDKQGFFFNNKETRDNRQRYSMKIETPIYRPRRIKPHIFSLYDNSKTARLIEEIGLSAVSEEEKSFFYMAAHRHTVFHYENIADYYAHASPETKKLMESSALVIIDLDSAIERGYVKLCKNIMTQFYEEYPGVK